MSVDPVLFVIIKMEVLLRTLTYGRMSEQNLTSRQFATGCQS